MIYIEYLVRQYYDNEAPDDFGFLHLDHQPIIGEIIQLYWLDHQPVYKFKINRIDKEKKILHGISVDEGDNQ